MRKRFLISLFLVCNLLVAKGQTQEDYLTFFNQILEGKWLNLHFYFNSEAENKKFLSHFTKDPGHLDNLIGYQAFKLKSINKETAVFINADTKIEVHITVVLQIINGFSKVANFSITNFNSSDNQRVEDLTNTSGFTYVSLPTSEKESPKYMNSFLTLFNESMDINQADYSQDIAFRQLDFTPLKLKFRWCEKVGFFNFCRTVPYERAFGPVLSDKDDPDNDIKYVKSVFLDISDMTAFKATENVAGFNPSQNGKSLYVLTAAIIDPFRSTLTLFREGLLPWDYNGGLGANQFIKPMAVKSINGFLYVLDVGNDITPPKIHILKVFNTIIKDTQEGNFGVEYIGQINTSIINLINPRDVGGYESLGSSHKLLIADDNGLNVISIDKTYGTPVGQIKTFSRAIDYNNSDSKSIFNLQNISRVDARNIENSSDLGCVVLLLENNIVSITASELEIKSSNSSINTFFCSQFKGNGSGNNLAYMLAEQKWYITDFLGQIHKLDNSGRYLGGGGKFGPSEGNNELFLPNAITPNPIGIDPDNEFCYRFMVANKWGYSTGIKLFSPGIFISKLKAFENLNNKDLTFAFTMSGNWAYIEGAQSIQMQAVKINGTKLLNSHWNTQVDGTIHNKIDLDFLTKFPETISLSPGSLMDINNHPFELKRGWNTFKIEIEVKKILEGQEVIENVEKKINFYWLPSLFSPPSDMSGLSILDIALNNSPFLEGSSASKDYIYKSIELRGKGIFYIPYSHPIFISEFGNLQLYTGASLYNYCFSNHGLGNVYFKGNGKLTIKGGAYICTFGDGRFKDNGYSLPSLTENLILDPGYKKGLNPSPDVFSKFNNLEQNQCKSACEFLAGNVPAVKFTAVVDLSNNNPFKVTVNPAGTTYFNKLKWEVEEVGNTTKKGSFIIDAIAPTQVINLNEKITYNSLPYQFLSCKDYKITLSTGCNDGTGAIEWISTSAQTIGINYPIFPGADQFVCDYVAPLQMTDFYPALNSNGGTSVWTAPAGITVSTSGLVTVSATAAGLKNTAVGLTYKYTDKYGCAKTTTQKLTVYARPATPASVTTNSPLCESKPLTLTTPALTNASYKWTFANNQVIESALNTTTVPSATTMNGTLKAAVKLNGCYSLDKTANIIINPLPVITVPSPVKNVCKSSNSISLVVNAPTVPVIWTSITGSAASASNLIKTTSTDAWDAGAFSLQSITNGGFLEVTAIETNKNRMIGLSPTNPDVNYTSIHYAIYLTNTGTVEIYEKGVKRTASNIYIANDKFKIMSEGGVIKYYRNNIPFYTSTVLPTFPLFADASLYSNGATLNNVNIASQGTGVWTGTAITGSGSNYTFSPATAGPGTFPLTYTFTSTGTGCVSTASQTMVIGPVIQLGPNETVCSNSPSFSPSVINPPAGIWSESGVNLIGNQFNPLAKPIGTYILTYEVSDLYGCTNTATKTITVKGTPAVSISPVQPTGIRYKYYENIRSGAWTSVSDMTGLIPVAEGIASDINVVPKLVNANYGLVYEGYIAIQTAGAYTFYLTSKDGSKLYINDVAVINNDAVHASAELTSSAITLSGGLQKIKVEYFNTTYSSSLPDVLGLKWSGPSISKQTIPATAYKSPVTYCDGSSVAVTASGGTSFLWSNGSVEGPSLNISSPGIYNVTMKDADGCQATSNAVIVNKLDNPSPAIVTSNGLSYSYYENDGTAWYTLPDFTTLTPVKTGFTPLIDLSQVNRDPNMGMVYDGHITIPTAGSYTFYTNSDDGSQLFIDNLLVTDNNGNHAAIEKSGVVSLRPGLHKIKVLYYNASTTKQLTVSYQGPGISKQVIPSSVLYNLPGTCILGTVNLGSSVSGTYKWNTNATTSILPFTTNGVYTLEVTKSNGCKTTSSRNISTTTPPTAEIVSSTPNFNCFGVFTQGFLIGSPTGVQPFKYQWLNNGTNIASSNAQTYTATTVGNYTLKVTDGCGTSVNSLPFALDIINQPDFAISTDLTGSTPTMCASGSTARIRVDISAYNSLKNYDVTLTPGNITTSVLANPSLTITDGYNGYNLSSPWKYLNTSVKEGSLEVNSTLKLSGWNTGLLSTGSDFTSVWRDDLRGNIDVKVRVSPVVSTNSSARAGILLANDLKTLSGGGHCAVSLGASKSFMFQYDLNGDGTLEAIANTGVISTTFTSAFVRLKKSGTIITAYYSLGQTPTTWVQIGSATIPSIKTGSQLALFVSSHHTGIIATGTLDDFEAVMSQPLIEFPINGPGTYTVEVKDKTGDNTCITKKKSITIGSKPIPSLSATLPVSSVCFNALPVDLTGGSPAGGIWSGFEVSRKLDDDFGASGTLKGWTNIYAEGYAAHSVTQTNGILQVKTRGSDVNQFVSSYRSDIKGDFDVSVKINSQSGGSSTAALAGIMIANNFNTLAEGGYAFIASSPTGFVFQYDNTAPAGYPETIVKAGSRTIPCWLRLKKTGNQVTAYYRLGLDNSWTQVGTAQTPLLIKTDVQVGLFGSGMDPNIEMTAQFDDFKTENAANTLYQFQPSNQTIGTNNLTYTVTGTNGCSASVIKTINVADVIPVISSLGPDIVIEKNAPVTLSVTSNLPVIWSTGGTANSISYIPTTTTTITVSASNVCGTITEDIILIDPCTFTGYKTNPDATISTPLINANFTGGGTFSGVYLVEKMGLYNGTYIFKPGTILLMKDESSYIIIGDYNSEIANVIMDGVNITSSCDMLWYRIEVRGKSSLQINKSPYNLRSIIQNSKWGIYGGVLITSPSLIPQIKIDNVDFKNNLYYSLLIAANADITAMDWGTNISIENCTFDSKIEEFKKPYQKTSTQSYLSDIHLSLGTGDFSKTIVDKCIFKNCRTGMFLQNVSKLPIANNNNFSNCHQYGIFSWQSYSSINYPLVNIDMAMPSQAVSTNNINYSDVATGIYDQRSFMNVQDSKFYTSENVLSHTKSTMGIYSIDTYWPFTDNPYFRDNIFDKIKTGIYHNITGPPGMSSFIKNKFYNCNTGIEGPTNNSFSSSLICNTFENNLADYKPVSTYIVDNSNCANRRSDFQVSSSIIPNEVLEIKDLDLSSLTKMIKSNTYENKRLIYKAFLKGSENEKTQVLDQFELIKNQNTKLSDSWLALFKQIDLITNAPKLNFEKDNDSKFLLSVDDSLRLQWMANSGTEYSYNACRQLRFIYPFAPCNVQDVEGSNLSDKYNDNIYMGQNIPNPAVNHTVIPLFVPFKQNKIFVELRNAETGILILTLPVDEIGNISLNININNIASGVYFYSLFMDGAKMDTKKMIIVK